ncbi:ABC transporter ATP-binding protein [Saccharothrix sp. NRRL B-16314]|uniref:ABC transporter ATP-binding protein n=1 Tax=Saccharothrix sp. NRRL B-16314 TaxID=1463825 RepID=UPI0005254E2E|nr:export ABC transporter ATP-binding protein [Saccharothrix sp. NRRL B-16314]
MDGIVTRSLRKSFPVRDRLFGRSREHVAVDGLTLTVPPGSVTGLLGLNGAGKTTTIKVLATLLRPTSGTVTVDGLDVVTQARDVRQRINLIAGGERMVYARMTGRENLRYFGLLYGVPTKVLPGRVDELLDLVGLTDAGDTVVERYSRGMTQRLSIARGLVNDPAYLLLDEPTLGLDAPVARDLRRVVASLAARGKGVLLTSHYLTEVEELCANVHVIAGGRHLAEGTPAELTAATGGNRKVRVTVARHSASLAAAVAGFADRLGVTATCDPDDDGGAVVSLSHPDDVAGPLVTAIVAAGGAVTGLELSEPSLEDAIIALAGQAPEPVVV